MKKDAALVLGTAWIGGIVSMIYELVWVKYLGLLLGNSTYAVGTVTGCYMIGMAAGEFFIGGRAKKSPEKLQRIVTAGLALVLFLSPVMYRVLDAVNRLGIMAGGPAAGRMVWRVCISLAAMLIPTFLIGGLLPVLTAGKIASGGMIYAFHSLGAVTGAVLTGFFLIRYIGLSGSTAAGAFLMAGAFAAVFLNGRKGHQGKRVTAEQEKETDRKQGSGKGAAKCCPAGTRKRILAAYCLSGFTGMAFQVYQTRILTLFFMDSVYDFAVILAVFLAGTWLGNLASSFWAERSEKPLRIFAGSQVILGICSLLSLHIVSRLPFWTENVRSQSTLYEIYGENGLWVGIGMKAACTAAILLVPAFLWGMAYPLAAKLCIDDNPDPGREAGIVLGVNTVGSAAGSLAASFLLVGLLGIQNAVLLNGCLNLAAGCLLIHAQQDEKRKTKQIWIGVSAAAGILVIAGAPKWDRFEMSTSFLAPGQDVEGYVDIRFYKEDAYGITSVVDFLPYEQTYLTTNRLYCQNTSDMNGAEDHRRLGYIPLLLHPEPKKVLVEGLGAGITLRGVQEYGGLQIDCVEISGAVAEAAACFREENGGVLDSSDVALMIDDARNYLTTANKKYDVIIADIFFPMSSGSGSMFSREYYEACRAALEPGGMMVQWIPIHQFSERELDITMKTFSQVFPETTVWFGMLGNSVPAAGLVGSDEPLEISFERLEDLYAGESSMDLYNTALDDPYMFLSHFICSVRPEDFSETIPINTDDRPVLEYLNPLDTQTYSERGKTNLRKLLEQKDSAAEFTVFGNAEQKEILKLYDQEIAEFITRFTE